MLRIRCEDANGKFCKYKPYKSVKIKYGNQTLPSPYDKKDPLKTAWVKKCWDDMQKNKEQLNIVITKAINPPANPTAACQKKITAITQIAMACNKTLAQYKACYPYDPNLKPKSVPKAQQ